MSLRCKVIACLSIFVLTVLIVSSHLNSYAGTGTLSCNAICCPDSSSSACSLPLNPDPCGSGLSCRITGYVDRCRVNPCASDGNCQNNSSCNCCGYTPPAPPTPTPTPTPTPAPPSGLNECITVCTRPISSPPTCASVIEHCDPGYACPSNFKDWVVTFLLVDVPSWCIQTSFLPDPIKYTCTYPGCVSGPIASPPPVPPPPGGPTGGECKKEARPGPPAGDYWKKINCSGRCPGPSGGEPTSGPCIACRAPNPSTTPPDIDLGVCALQPNGEIFDSCCPGSVAQRDGAGCTCQPTKDAVYRLFELINGVMIPVVIILGIFLIVLKGYKIMTSQGDPAALQEGKEGLTSAIIGLIFVLMAVSILRVIIKALISGDSSPF